MLQALGKPKHVSEPARCAWTKMTTLEPVSMLKALQEMFSLLLMTYDDDEEEAGQ